MRALRFLHNQYVLKQLKIDEVKVQLHLSFLQLVVGYTSLYTDTSEDTNMHA